MERAQKRELKSSSKFQLKGRFKDLQMPNFVRPMAIGIVV